ncbi:hypothetical protein AX16_007305 [Volvariella volvacea WC 439]|nr:hypothetical protein AX16_007305 [Volvariella volvacea WC 439]
MPMDTAPPSRLSHELLVYILEFVKTDYPTLANCALVNSAVNRAASQVLYAKAIYSPAFKAILNLRDRGAIPEPSLFASACLPKYAQYVLSLNIAGYLSTRPPPLNVFPASLLNAIQSFSNLRRVSFRPSAFPDDLFTEPLKALKGNSSTAQDKSGQNHQLESLIVGPACQDEIRAPLLVEISGLKKLAVHSPTRALLELLPGWLDRLSNGLKELHLKDNCGSITPGVLNSLLLNNCLQEVQALTLGLSYSLTDEDVFNFLAQLPQLEHLQLRYYLQLKTPKSRPHLKNLYSFTVQYAPAQSRSEVLKLCKWIRLGISSSPLQRLYLFSDDSDAHTDLDDDDDEIFAPALHRSLHIRISNSIRIRPEGPDGTTNDSGGETEGGGEADEPGSSIAFDSLINHLVVKHPMTLKILDMRSAFIGVDALRTLFIECVVLEEFYLSAGRSALAIFEQHASGLKSLHTAGFNIRNAKPIERRISHELAVQLIQSGPAPRLRRLVVGGMMWQGSYVTRNGQVGFVVERVYKRIPPWNRD